MSQKHNKSGIRWDINTSEMSFCTIINTTNIMGSLFQSFEVSLTSKSKMAAIHRLQKNMKLYKSGIIDTINPALDEL